MSRSEIRAYSEVLKDLLKEIRRDRNLTQVELAAVLEQSQSFVSKYESGERTLNILEVRSVCRGLGVSFLDFCARLEKRIAHLEGSLETE